MASYHSLSETKKIAAWVSSLGFYATCLRFELSDGQLRNLIYHRNIAKGAYERVLELIAEEPPRRQRRACSYMHCVGDGWIAVTDLCFVHANLCEACRKRRQTTALRNFKPEKTRKKKTYPAPTPCPSCGGKRKYATNLLYCIKNRCPEGSTVMRPKENA